MNKITWTDQRAFKIIQKTIRLFELNLNEKVVLTEAGTNFYNYTPIIAALAGAKEVIAWIKSNSYGKAKDVADRVLTCATHLNIESHITIRCDIEPIEDVQRADIITNSGNIRPLNQHRLQYTKTGAVIPLMYESWEIRDADIDIEYCKKNKIKVAGTWENHPKVKVFDYGGSLAIKLANEAGFEVFLNSIWVWSDDEFGEVAAQAFKSAGAKQVYLSTDVNLFKEKLNELDFVYICNYHERQAYLGNNGLLPVDTILEQNPTLGIIHLYGDIDPALAPNMNIYPLKKGKALHMTQTLGYVGLEPIIKLQTAGFKVAQELFTDNVSNLSQPLTFA